MTTAATRSNLSDQSRPGRGRPGQSRTVGWSVAGAQYGYTLGYASCIYAALARAAELTGHWYVPGQDDVFTAAADIDSDWGWSFVVGTVLSLAPVLGGLALLVNAMLFLLGHTRGSRALTVSLLGATAATLLTLVVSLTPAAQSITGWLLD